MRFLGKTLILVLLLLGTACEERESTPGPIETALDAALEALSQFDSDGDGIADSEDQWPFFIGMPTDQDSDGLPDIYDIFPTAPGIPSQPGSHVSSGSRQRRANGSC